MRIRFVAALVATVAALAPATGYAGNTCVTYSVTGPVIGTKSGNHCVPGNPYSQGFTFGSCGGTPPIGESHCWSVKTYVP